MALKLLVWDFDGTLANSHALIVAGMSHTLDLLALPNSEAILQSWMRCVGLPVEEGLKRTFAPLGVEAQAVLSAYRAFDWQKHEHLLAAYDGMKELLQTLSAKGVPMAIASSKRQVPLQRQLTQLGWERFFHPIVTPDEVTCGKPHPESLLCCLAAHGCHPREAIMIGDAPFDLEMANRANVPAIGVGYGFYDKASLLACNPMAFAPDVLTLDEILLSCPYEKTFLQ